LYSEGGVVDVLVDTADTFYTAVSCNADKAFLSPAGAPGVPDDVVLNSVLLTPTDCNNSVVNRGGTTLGGSDNTRRVTLENVVAGSDGDVDRLFGKLSQVCTHALHLAVGGNAGNAFGGGILAGSVLSSVRVIRLLHGLVFLEPVV